MRHRAVPPANPGILYPSSRARPHFAPGPHPAFDSLETATGVPPSRIARQRWAPRTSPRRARLLSVRRISDWLDLVEERLGIGVEDALALIAAEIERLALVYELGFGGVRRDFHHANRIQC